MRANDRRVDHGVLIVGIVGQDLEKILPYACLRPTREPGMNILPGAEAFWQIAPGRSRAELPDDSLDEKLVAPFTIAANVPGPARQQMLDARKLVVA